MPAGSCPVICPCKATGYGAFVSAAAIFAAVNAPVFFGKNFSALLVLLYYAPERLPLPFIVWAVVLLAGLVVFGVNVARVIRWKRDDVPFWRSLAAALVCIVILCSGWTLPRAWGPLAVTGFDVVCRALLFAALLNLWLGSSMRQWWLGFAAGEDDARGGGEPAALFAAHADLFEQDAEIKRLRLEMKNFVDLLGGRRAVLSLLHPDNKPEAERLAATERFQKAGEFLARIGKR